MGRTIGMTGHQVAKKEVYTAKRRGKRRYPSQRRVRKRFAKAKGAQMWTRFVELGKWGAGSQHCDTRAKRSRFAHIGF